jgi:hypothetical protein
MGGSAGRCGERFLDLSEPIQLCREKIQNDKASHTSLHTDLYRSVRRDGVGIQGVIGFQCDDGRVTSKKSYLL